MGDAVSLPQLGPEQVWSHYYVAAALWLRIQMRRGLLISVTAAVAWRGSLRARAA
jgi:hypothetical protein